MALLANLRNISGAGVDRDLVLTALLEGAARSKALPFRFIQAWRHAPAFAPAISTAMIAALQERERLAGTTAIVVDVSYSMQDTMSGKSQATRLDAASGLAVMLANLCEDCRLWTFSYKLAEVPVAKGIELIDGIKRSQPMQGTYLRAAVEKVAAIARGINRIIVITDEQSHDGIPVATFPLAYLVNVAPYKPGLDVSNGWTRISGFSERIVEWIQMEEAPARGMPDDLIVT
jgi:hypothetical protein